MRLRHLSIEGFQSYREQEEIDLSGLNFTAIVGANHSGKSSLINAVEFALWGRSRGPVVGDVVTRGASRAQVALTFDLGDGTYRVTRSRSAKGSPEAVLAVQDETAPTGWRELTDKNPKTTDPEIVALLGMTSHVARLTWLIGQNDYGAFCTLLPAERRDRLAEAFGLDVYADLAARTEERRAAASVAHQRAQYDRDSILTRRERLIGDGAFPHLSDEQIVTEAEAAEAAAEVASTELAAITDASLEDRVNQARTAMNVFTQAHDAARNRHLADQSRASRDLADAEAAFTAAQTAVDAAEDAAWGLAGAESLAADASKDVADRVFLVEQKRTEVAALRAEIAAAEADMRSLAARAAEINERRKPLDESIARGEGACYTCHQPLSAEHAHNIISTEETEKATLKAQHEEAGARKHALEVDVAAAERDLAALDRDVSDARRGERTAADAVTTLRGRAETLPERQAAFTTATEKVTAAREAVLSLGEPPQMDDTQFTALSATLRTAEAAYRDATGDPERQRTLTTQRDEKRRLSRSLWQEQQRRTQVAADLAALDAPLHAAEEKLATTTKEMDGYSVLLEAFRPSGIPLMILSTVVDEINEAANEIIALMGDDGLSVQVSTSTETAKGSTSEKVMVYAVTADGAVDYSTLSGSEQARVALAVRLGLSECIARRTGTPIETIVMDECWGMFDDAGKRAVLDVLARMSARFSIFSISHIEDVSASFPQVLAVNMGSGTSRTTVVRG